MAPGLVGLVHIPARFEALRDTVGAGRLAQVLIEPVADVNEMKRAIADVAAARQGKLLFLLGGSGTGKTSLAESLPIFLPKAVAKVVTPPPDYALPLAELPKWLSANVQAGPGTSVTVVNLDGREIPAVDEQVTQGAMVNLNAFLRRTPNILALWPIVSPAFANDAIARLGQLGGQSALAQTPIYNMSGLPQDRYFDALRLILDATSTKLEDAAISQDEALALVNGSPTPGEYLTKVHALVVQRYDLGELGERLPRLYIVVSALNDTSQACRVLRRGNRFAIDPDRLLQFSRSNVADDWKARGGRNARHALAFITSLFEAKILNLSASAFVNACAWSDDADIADLVRKHYPQPIKRNADNSLTNSSLVRGLRAEEDVGFAAKQDPSGKIKEAYLAVQARTKDKHNAINYAIMNVVRRLVPDLPTIQVEHHPMLNQGKELRADVWFKRGERPEAVEFTHYENASEAIISSYVLEKIQDYARDYGLI